MQALYSYEYIELERDMYIVITRLEDNKSEHNNRNEQHGI